MPVYLLGEKLVFPPPEEAEPDGLLAVGGDLSVERLRLAYRSGIFPWYGEGEPIAWYSPDPRLVIRPPELRVTKSLRRAIRRSDVRLTADRAFTEVIARCASIARRHEAGTWITRDMMGAYTRLHEAGDAHSVEVWCGRELIGGLYGVAAGACFSGESMFSGKTSASKIAFAHLVERLSTWGFALVDCQLPAGHLERLGGVPWSRRRFLAALERARGKPGRPGSWRDVEEIDGATLLERLGAGSG